MNLKNFSLIILGCILTVSLLGCGQQAANSKDAIEVSKSKKTVEEQVNYLVSQAKSFVSQDKHDEAINISQYVLANLDKESKAAREIIEQAKAELKATAVKTADDIKNTVGNLGK